MVRIERIRAQKLYKKGRGGVSPPVSHRLVVNWIAKLVVYGAGAETHSFGAVSECPLLIPLVGFHLVFFSGFLAFWLSAYGRRRQPGVHSRRGKTNCPPVQVGARQAQRCMQATYLYPSSRVAGPVLHTLRIH